ncbi:hypothetical protein NPIL_581521 [Nephila pilipes]|uniref:Uncharacterized protein n=1 Tax=Nephila pilipes TaxID=299642 RepID=A0A8X6Q5P7_NEPPI|nr:hypothetical protein NPIL_581521 [Nephila pilipes]
MGKTARPDGQNMSSDPSIDWEMKGGPNGGEKENLRIIPIGNMENGSIGSGAFPGKINFDPTPHLGMWIDGGSQHESNGEKIV